MVVIFWAFVALSLAWLALFLAGKRVPKPWLVALGVSPVVLIYIVNPEFRVYSFHGFMHAGITYQIMNGIIPPADPLLAGHTVVYPWGCHLVAALLCRVFNITPFMALAALNVVSLALAIILVYKISKLIVDNERANILSVVVSLYAITLANPTFMKILPETVPSEFRGVPILLKFITINVLPEGLVLFLVFIYSVLSLERTGKILPGLPLLVGSILGVGVAYPAFLPGIGASLVLLWIASLVLLKYDRLRWSLKTIALTVASLVVAVLIVRPLLATLGAGTASQLQILEPKTVVPNLVKYLVVTVPILAVILGNIAAIRAMGVDLKGLWFIGAVAASTGAVYVALHLNMDNEYKFLLLSTVALGIPGGIAFAAMAQRLPGPRRIVVFILLGLFLFPTFRFVSLKLVQERAGRASQAFVEKGRSLRSTDNEADELYQWIATTTGKRSAIVDTELEAPVLAQRPLFIAASGRDPGQRKGFGPVDMILRLQSGYPDGLLRLRRAAVEKIYGGRDLTPAEAAEISGLPGDTYVVLRAGQARQSLESTYLEKVFTSGQGRFTLYRIVLPQ